MAELRRQVARPERVLLVAPSLMIGVGVAGVVAYVITPFSGVFRPVTALVVGVIVWLWAWQWSAREPHVETVIGEWFRMLGISGPSYPPASTRNTWGEDGNHYER